MPYIGNTPADKFLTLAKQNFSTSATTSYTLDSAVSSTQDIALFINSVRQSPVDAYTVSGTALTLTSATAGTDEMYCIFLAKTVGTVSPASDSIATAMIQANAVNNAKMADDAIGLAELSATGTPSSSNFLRGDNSWASAGGDMTPLFYARGNSEQTGLADNVTTKRIFGSEIFDADGVYDTSTGLFTVPSAGKYCIIAGLNIDGGSNTGTEFALGLSLNSDTSATGHTFLNFSSASLKRWDANISVLASLSGGNTVGVYGRMNTSSGTWNMYSSSNSNYFGAFKLIE